MMICLHRPNGSVVYVNPELIESIEEHADTSVRMKDAPPLPVREAPADIIRMMTAARAVAFATGLRLNADPNFNHLAVIDGDLITHDQYERAAADAAAHTAEGNV
jgi:uncharacterized protein YlzI (FlbEa/FlbD family)